jgi:chemotaxis protein histidine kinase CheA/CheY-like chemotaxis protein
MHQDEELEVRMMFLEEAIEYIDSIEDGLVDLDPRASTFRSRLDGVLRAAHSLKGGAAMMQFDDLSHAAHLLEDSLKIIKENRPEIDFEIEGLLFNSSEILRQIVRQSKSGRPVDREWLETQVFPLFEKLENQLSSAEPAEGIGEEEEEEVNLAAIMFESEVDSYLEQLEGLVTDPTTSPTLDADIVEIAGDLAAMGEMLELSNFVALCQSVLQALVAKSHPAIDIAEAALSAWRSAQALVMIGNINAIPTRISLPLLEEKKLPDLATTEELLLELEEALEITDTEFLTDLDEIAASSNELAIETVEATEENKPQTEPDIREMFNDLESYLNSGNELEPDNIDDLIPEGNLTLDLGLTSDDNEESEISVSNDLEPDNNGDLNLEDNLTLDPGLTSEDNPEAKISNSTSLEDSLNHESELSLEGDELDLENELNDFLDFEDKQNLREDLALETETNLKDYGNELNTRLNLEENQNSVDSLDLDMELGLDLEDELGDILDHESNFKSGDRLNPENGETEAELKPENNLTSEDSLDLGSELDSILGLEDNVLENNVDLENTGTNLDFENELPNELTETNLNLELDLENEIEVILDSEDEPNSKDNIAIENEVEDEFDLEEELSLGENDLTFEEDLNLEGEVARALRLEQLEVKISEEDEESLDEDPIDEEERAVRMMFLEEASEYIDSIDDGLTDFDTSASNFKQQIDQVLRAAHSLKGGAAMMQFNALSQAAHRLEDSFKILKENRPAINQVVEGLLFNSAEILRQIVREYKQGTQITTGWLNSNAFPTFEALEAQLNIAEATGFVEDEEEEVNLVVMMFESEVESYLDRLEGLVTGPEASSTLYTELAAIAEDLAGIGEMLELPNFVSLCQSVTQALADRSSPVARIAESSLAAWRNAQALVTIGNTEAIATQITLPPLAEEELSEILEEVYAELSEDAQSLEAVEFITDSDFLADADELADRLADEDELFLGTEEARITESNTNIIATADAIETEEDLDLAEVDSSMEALADLNSDEVDNIIEVLDLGHAEEFEDIVGDQESLADEEPLDEEERAVRMMFLEEASEYIDSIDDGLADFDTAAGNFKQRIDQVLRAAHSLKGGAAMMQFDALSLAAHRLEDSFKLLKENRPVVSPEIERLLCNSSEMLRQIVRQCKQGNRVTLRWLETNAFTTFEALEAQLNAAKATEPVAEEEEEVSLVAMMFESEVEAYLDRLETLITNRDPSSKLDTELDTELASITEDLAGIGEILELPNFVSLCQSVTQALAIQSHPTLQIAEAALAGWRNAQALVIIDNTRAIATQISLPALEEETGITDAVPHTDITEPEEFENLLPLDITVGEFAADIDEFATELEDISIDSTADQEIVGEISLNNAVLNDGIAINLAPTELEIDDMDSVELERSQVTDSFDDLDIFTPESDELEDELEDELIFESERLDTPFQDRTLEAFIFESVFDVADNIDLFASSSSSISAANKNNKRKGRNSPARDNCPPTQENTPRSSDRASTATISKPISQTQTVTKPVEPAAQPSTQTSNKSTDTEQAQSKTLPVSSPTENLVTFASPTDPISPPQVETLDDLSTPPNSVSPLASPKESYPQVETLGDFAIASTEPELPVTPSEVSPQVATLDDFAVDTIDIAMPVTVSDKVDEDSVSSRSTQSTNVKPFVKTSTSSKTTTEDKQGKGRKSSNDMPALKTNKGKDFSAYVKPAQEETPSKTQKASKSQDAAGSLFELFEDLDTSQESNDLPISLPQSVSDMLSAYLKEASIRLPVSRLEQMYDISEELSIGNNGVDQQLRRMRSLVKTLDGRMRELENTNLQLQSAYDRMTLQNSLGLVQSESQSAEGYSEYTDLDNALAVVDPIVTPEISAYADFDNLEMDRYGELHSLSQSVIETIVQLEEAIADVNLTLAEAEQNASNQNRHFKQLQTTIAQIRMRPISDIVGKFPRVIRSLSMQHGKDVDLVIEGGESLIDRVILDALSDPLNHILRNAFDHGIEVASVRAERGKPAQGTILIKTLFQSDKILVKIQDDGGGIDAEKIRNKVRKMALESGRDTSQIDAIPRQKLLSLIFEPGFSTADKVTSLSGRGVGMDVVKTNLNQIGAQIAIDTEVGVGTTFTIAIPFTLLSTRVLLVQVNQMILAIPSTAIAGVMACNSTDIFKQGDRYGFVWQGQTLPVVQLSDQLKLNCQHQIEYIDDRIVTSGTAMIIVELNNELAAILADTFWSEQEATIRQIEGNIKLPKLFSACIILGSGQAVPLLDLNEVASQFLTGMELLIPPAPKLTAAELEESTEPKDLVESPEPIESSESISLTESPESIESIESTSLIESYEPTESSPTALIEPPELPKSKSISSPSSLDLPGGTDSLRAGTGTPPLQLESRSSNPQSPKAKTRISILVVDDSINVRRFLALTLEKAGFRVEQAKDGEEALAKIVDGLRVNAVVSDVEMPRLDGYGLLSQIRAKPEHSKLPVIMLTSRSGDKHRRLAMNLGATGYFTKPYQERELVNTLRELTQVQGGDM